MNRSTNTSCIRHFAAQRKVIVQVLVSQCQGVHSLPKQRACVVGTACTPAWILKRPGHRVGQTQAPVGLAQQQRTAVGGQLAAVATRLEHVATNAWKLNRVLVK